MRPRLLLPALALCGAWALASLVPITAPRTAEVAKAPGRVRALSREDTQGFRAELKELAAQRPFTAEAAADARGYNALLERLEAGKLTRAEAIQALLSLEKRLTAEDDRTLADDAAAFAEISHDLAKADDVVGSALERHDLKAAASALEDVAKKLPTQRAEARQRLKKALSKIAERQRAEDRAAERARELESLLKRNQEPPPGSEAEKQLLKRNRRELERLRRENASTQARRRELSRLQRDLANAFDAMQQSDTSRAEEELQKAGDELRRHAEQQLTSEQRQALSRQVAQLRELLQRERESGQAGQGGSGREERRKRFMLRAAGQDPDKQKARLSLQKPQGGAQASSGEGEEGESKPAPGAQQQGQVKGQAGERVFELGGEGEPNAELLLPDLEQRMAGVEGASDEHDPRQRRTPTDIQSELRDTQLQGAPGRGPTRSEVILDAADRGFATTSYRNVYTEYRNHAEEVLEKDEIPAGYRFYVRRYFQLIRPREAKENP